jgi:hypothetical protein
MYMKAESAAMSSAGCALIALHKDATMPLFAGPEVIEPCLFLEWGRRIGAT